jgi:hypothetical protein
MGLRFGRGRDQANLGPGNTTVECSRQLKLYEIVRSARFLSPLSCVCGTIAGWR